MRALFRFKLRTSLFGDYSNGAPSVNAEVLKPWSKDQVHVSLSSPIRRGEGASANRTPSSRSEPRQWTPLQNWSVEGG